MDLLYGLLPLLIPRPGELASQLFFCALIGTQVFGGRPHDRANAIAVYKAHVEAVLATVPPERLLVHHLGDGWEPLCQHLGVAVPDQPYPTRNSKTDFLRTTEEH